MKIRMQKTKEVLYIFHSKIFLLFETLSLIVLPLVLIWFMPEILHYRIQILVGSFVYFVYLFVVVKLSLKQIGFSLTNFKKSFESLMPVTIIVFAILIASIPFKYDARFLFIEFLAKEALQETSLWNILTSLLISASVQEIIFRGFYITRLELISKNKYFLVIMSSLVFSLIHAPFKNNLFTVGTFVLGVIYSLNFIKYRSIYPIIISHILLLGGLSLAIIY